MAALFDKAAEAGVGGAVETELDGVGVNDGDVLDGTAGNAVAVAPWPNNAFVGKVVGTVLTILAEALNWSYAGMEGGLIAPTIPDVQWNDGSVFAQ